MSYHVAGQQRTKVDGEEVLYGPCQNSNREGYSYVFFPDRNRVFIVDSRYATEREIQERGRDMDKWTSILSHHGEKDKNDMWNI